MSLLGHVSKIVSILLSKLAIVSILTHHCATVTPSAATTENLRGSRWHDGLQSLAGTYPSVLLEGLGLIQQFVDEVGEVSVL